MKKSRNFIDEHIDKIVEGDFLEISPQIPSESADLVVVDPPYNSDIEWDKKDNKWQEKWLREAYRIMKPNSSLYCFFAPLNCLGVFEIVSKLFKLKNLLVWHHRNLYGCGLSYGKDRYKSTWEIVFYATKGKGKDVQQRAYKNFGTSFDVIIEPAILKHRFHKAQKPLKVISRFIICSSDEGDIVLDPFCGSGTTCVAAKKLNRRFIGIELDSRCCNKSRQRLGQPFLEDLGETPRGAFF